MDEATDRGRARRVYDESFKAAVIEVSKKSLRAWQSRHLEQFVSCRRSHRPAAFHEVRKDEPS